MSRATSSTRSVMITRSLLPRISWTCCASCTRMVLSSSKIEPLGREHSNITSWSENTFRPSSQRTPRKLSFWDLCRANGEFKSDNCTLLYTLQGSQKSRNKKGAYSPWSSRAHPFLAGLLRLWQSQHRIRPQGLIIDNQAG